MNDARRSFQQPPDGKKKEKKRLRRLDQGQIVKSKNFTWTINEILGSGGFGDVYKVRGEKENEVHAMKTEYNDPKQRKSNDRLKIEMSIFNDFNNQSDPEKSKHFLKMIDKGQTDSFKWIVMTLVSHSLDVLRRDYLESMTWSSIFNISLQTLKAVEQLHDCGYLHRDIKPHNFAIGIPPKDTTIFMIDFGIARRFMDKDGKLRIPRQTVRFLGTVRFASRSCHNEKEQSRRDDLESWCYMVLDLFNPENITWRRVTDRTKVAVYKHQLFTRQDNKEIDGPKEMYKIIAYVNELGYTDVPSYDKIRDFLLDGAKEEKLDLTRKFDWVGVELKKKTNSKKKGPYAANRITDDDEDTEPSKKKKKEERRKRFSMENDDTDSDDDIPLPKPIARRSVSKMGPSPSTGSLFAPPSSKARMRKSGFGPAPGGGTQSINISMQKASPAQSGVKMTTGIAPGPRDQSLIQSPCVSTGTTGPRSNYNTAIPRTPRRESSVMNIPSGKNKGGKKDEGEKNT